MTRLIDANALLNGKQDHDMIDTHIIFNAPTIDAVPVRHGKWIEKSTGGEQFYCCSECGHIEWDAPSKYCPNCGARMDKE